MAYRGVIDVFVQIEKFRNVDLFHQGLYCLKCRLYTAKRDSKDPAELQDIQYESCIPYAHSSHGRGEPAAGGSFLDPHHVGCAYIDEGEQTFNSRSFLIKYSDEEVQLNDSCEFRLELDAADVFERHALQELGAPRDWCSLVLEVDLMFADLLKQESVTHDSGQQNIAHQTCNTSEGNASTPNGSTGADLLTNSLAGSHSADKSHTCPAAPNSDTSSTCSTPLQAQMNPPELRRVSGQFFKIQNFVCGLHEFVPVVFDDSHCCSANILVHTCLLDLRYRLRSVSNPLSYPSLLRPVDRSAAVSSSEPSEGPRSFLQSLYSIDQAVEDVGTLDSNDEGVSVDIAEKYVFQKKETFNSSMTVKSRSGSFAGVWKATTDRTIEWRKNRRRKRKGNRANNNKREDAEDKDDEDDNGTDDSNLTNNDSQSSSDQSLNSSTVSSPPIEDLGRVQRFYLNSMKILFESHANNCRCARHINTLFGHYAEVGAFKSAISGMALMDYDITGNLIDINPLSLPGGKEYKFDCDCPGSDEAASMATGSLWSDAMEYMGNRATSLYYSATCDTDESTVQVDGNLLAMLLTQDISVISAQIFEISRKLLYLMPYLVKELSLCYRCVWVERMRDRLGEWMLSEDIIVSDKGEGVVRPNYLMEEETFSVSTTSTTDAEFSQLRPPSNGCSGIGWLRQASKLRRYSARDQLYINTAFTRNYKLGVLEVPPVHIGELHTKVAETLRRSSHLSLLEPLPVQDVNMLAEFQPVVFQQKYRLADSARDAAAERSGGETRAVMRGGVLLPPSCAPQKPSTYVGVHLFVLVHGFQGSAYDMRLVRNNLSMVYSSAVILCATCNQDCTEGDIGTMGERLAEEVRVFVQDWCPGNCLAKISFIGHSLGGVIVRSALPHLKAFHSKMHSFMSLSSPMLGYMHNASKLVDAGIWVLKKWRKSVCLQQLTMTDSKNPEDSFLYCLSLNSVCPSIQSDSRCAGATPQCCQDSWSSVFVLFRTSMSFNTSASFPRIKTNMLPLTQRG
eukprot:GHVQ01023499.1.p1 GENE.GHVQ01023499.1~~GHVQ01023499.1.p1  ORF type:complete len:1017 (+),score=145.88 GHVQ01023499.1:88-3138(+)